MPECGNSKVSPALWILLLAVAAISILTMPREEYTGDPQIIRCEAVALINNHDPAIPSPVVQEIHHWRGHYLFENPRNHEFYSKYGILGSILYAPPLLIEKWRATCT